MKWLNILLLLFIGRAAMALSVGDLTPEVSAPWTGGSVAVKPSDFKGQWLVVYFYPKSFTPGCTAEACSLRDGYGEIQKEGAAILGVSPDSIDQQLEFKGKYKLPFELVSDKKKTWSKAFDVLAFGGLFAQRKTFIINPEGRIAYIFEKAGTSGHDAEVLLELKKLKLNSTALKSNL
ncbi:MAG: peroxiredoxin [Lentisphaerota bacterium]